MHWATILVNICRTVCLQGVNIDTELVMYPLNMHIFSKICMIEVDCLTLLLRHITGQREQPSVQQQQMQPQNNHLTLTGRALRNTLFIRKIVARNSSGAT